jgi:hypothetical protein
MPYYITSSDKNKDESTNRRRVILSIFEKILVK